MIRTHPLTACRCTSGCCSSCERRWRRLSDCRTSYDSPLIDGHRGKLGAFPEGGLFMIGSRSRVILTAASAVVLGLAAVGCRKNQGGEVHSRTQDQTVRPDGTAVQTRSQVRETPSGATVQETQT